MHMTNDDMDELFNRAADEYPLNTDSADWGRVLQHLGQAGLAHTRHKKSEYKLLWLLLLLPIGFICGRMSDSAAVNPGPGPRDKIGMAAAVRIKESAPVAKLAGSGTSPVTVRVARPNSTQISSIAATGPGYSAASRRITNGNDRQTNEPQQAGKKTAPAFPDAAQRDGEVTAPGAAHRFGLQPVEMATAGDAEQQPFGPAIIKRISGEYVAHVMEPGLPSLSLAAGSLSQNVTRMTRHTGLYYSFVAGPDISTVRFQRTSRTGYSIGILAGYRLGKSWSVETGLLWDRKNYYSSGQYLDTTRLKLAMHSIVNTASGYCDMFEIPVNLSYEFQPGKNRGWFISAGLSTYLMKNEDYDLNYKRYGVTYTKEYGYRNTTNNWFSVATFSAGYRKDWGKRLSIRFEPYLKLPLRGIGIARLPLQSSGLTIRITRFTR